MEKPISHSLKTIFLVHAIVSLIFGLALWLIPGRFLELVGWIEPWVQLPESELSIPGGTFVDAYIVRVLGAALLALALSSFLGWRASQWGEVAVVVKLETAFCLLALLGVIANLVIGNRSMPAFGWLVLAFLVVFAVAWGWAWRDHAGG